MCLLLDENIGAVQISHMAAKLKLDKTSLQIRETQTYCDRYQDINCSVLFGLKWTPAWTWTRILAGPV